MPAIALEARAMPWAAEQPLAPTQRPGGVLGHWSAVLMTPSPSVSPTGAQAVAPTGLMNPDGHGAQDDAPTLPLKVFAGQGLQFTAPLAELNIPAGQWVQGELPLEL
jgi:hypothetical protein